MMGKSAFSPVAHTEEETYIMPPSTDCNIILPTQMFQCNGWLQAKSRQKSFTKPLVYEPIHQTSPILIPLGIGLLLLMYEPVRAFTLIWRRAWPHFGVLQNSSKMGKTVFLHAYPGTWV